MERPATIPITWVAAAAILLFGAWLRLRALDWPPLNDAEAIHALSAASGTPSESAYWEAQQTEHSALSPAYDTLTRPLFHLFGAEDWIARLLPALAGIAIVALPLFIVGRLGWFVALASAFLLATSTTMVTAARSASGHTLAALGLGMLLIILIGRTRPSEQGGPTPWLGLAAGLALASGPEVWMGLIGVAAVWAFGRLALPADSQVSFADVRRPALGDYFTGLAILLLLATAFGFRLESLAGVFASPGRWITAWGQAGELRLAPALLLLPAYDPLILVIGIAGAVLAFRGDDGLARLSTLWAGAAFAVFLLYPGRTAEQLIWVVLPLSLLGGLAMLELFSTALRRRQAGGSLGLAAALLVVTAFGSLMLRRYLAAVGPDPQLELRLGLAAAAFALGLVVLLGVGWSWRETFLGMGLASVLALLAATVSGTWRLNFGPSAAQAQDLWRPRATTVGVRLLQNSLEEISQAHIGLKQGLTVHAMAELPPSLAWIMRGYEPARSLPDPESPPPAIVAPVRDEPPRLPGEYLGQQLMIADAWGWATALPPNPLRWWVQRQAPTLPERWAVFVRTDVAGLADESEGG